MLLLQRLLLVLAIIVVLVLELVFVLPSHLFCILEEADDEGRKVAQLLGPAEHPLRLVRHHGFAVADGEPDVTLGIGLC